jgi:hypothetical protein
VKGTNSRPYARKFKTQVSGDALFIEVLLPLGCGVVLRACTPLFRAVKRFYRDHGYEAPDEEQSSITGDEADPSESEAKYVFFLR